VKSFGWLKHYDWKMELYWRMPIFLQETALSLYSRYLDGLYYGTDYDKWLRHFEDWKSWSADKVQQYQNQQLRSLIELAASSVSYYRERWKGVDWKSVRGVSDLPILPRLEKQSIRGNELAFLVEGSDPATLFMDKTSGTTGTSLRIYCPMSMLPTWWALTEVMVRNPVNVGQNIPRAMMGGRPVVPGNTGRPPYWRFNARWKQLYLSSYHVSRSTARAYAEAIQRYDSQWIIGYGSATAALAENCLAEGLPALRLRTVITSGDTLLSGMRTSIETFFQCKCIDHYGQSERVCMAQECSQGRMHVIPAAGIIEIVKEDGSHCGPGEVGEIVATGILNTAMPLIRYRMGDYAAWAVDQSCSCGNPHPIVTSLEGRLDDYLITGDGRKIGRLSTAVKRSPTIHSSQIVQDRPGHAYLLVRPGHGYRSFDAVAVKEDILERIGKFRIDILEVPEIPKTVAGKAALVVRLENRPDMVHLYSTILHSEKNAA
jgi:phenylacetate-CoA ligase